jgi:pyruvate kinase
VDAIMLSGETAAGDFPVRSVEVLASIIAAAETVAAPIAWAAPVGAAREPPTSDTTEPLDGFDAFKARHGRAMCEAAVTLASTGQADAIVAVTRLGKTAQLLSSLRPRATILAVTASDAVARRLQLHWGVRTIVSDLEDLRAVEDSSHIAKYFPRGAVVVFINVNPDLSRPDANFLNVQRLN